MLGKRRQKLGVDTTEATIRHQHHDIPYLMLAHDGVNDGWNFRNVTGLLTASAQIVHELIRVETLGLRKRRSEDRGEDHLVRLAKGTCEVVLKDTPA